MLETDGSEGEIDMMLLCLCVVLAAKLRKGVDWPGERFSGWVVGVVSIWWWRLLVLIS